MLEILPEKEFYRIHKSFIISLQKLELVEGNSVKSTTNGYLLGTVTGRSLWNTSTRTCS